MALSRRRVGGGLGGMGLAGVLGYVRPLRAGPRPRVVVIGGGAGGATCARYLAKDGNGDLVVTLVEPQARYTTCFYSNLYLAGWRSLDSIAHGYDGLRRAGVEIVPSVAVAVDANARWVRLEDGATLDYDRLVVAPGIDLDYGSIDGYGEAAAGIMPHAWKAGAQTRLLRSRIETMRDGGVFVIAVPAEPYRCPPAPYERASLVAAYFTRSNPRAKVLILDAKDAFAKQALFEEAWARHYPGMIEWVPGALGGEVVAVDTKASTVTTATGDVHVADVANIIPAQRAGRIAHKAGLTDESGWCPIAPADMTSRRQPGIHVLGDAAIANAMPKSAFAANNQAKVVATAIRSELTGTPASPQHYRNMCWSSLAPDDTVKIGADYRPTATKLESVDAFVSKVGEPAEIRRQTRAEADAWYATISADIFG